MNILQTNIELQTESSNDAYILSCLDVAFPPLFPCPLIKLVSHKQIYDENCTSTVCHFD